MKKFGKSSILIASLLPNVRLTYENEDFETTLPRSRRRGGGREIESQSFLCFNLAEPRDRRQLQQCATMMAFFIEFFPLSQICLDPLLPLLCVCATFWNFMHTLSSTLLLVLLLLTMTPLVQQQWQHHHPRKLEPTPQGNDELESVG